MIGNGTGNSVGELSGGGDLTRKHIGSSETSHHAALPYIKHSVGRIFLHKAHINDVSNVQQYNDSFKMLSHRSQHLLFSVTEKICTFNIFVVLLLAGSSAHYNNCSGAFLGNLCSKLIIHRHFYL